MARKTKRDPTQEGRALFSNLYFSGGAAFRDHNFSRFLDGVDQQRERSIALELRRHYEDPRGGLPPHIVATYRFTLSSQTWGSFLRAHPALPVGERDYCLSKLFQFLYRSLQIRYHLDDNESAVKGSLAGTLDQVPDDLLQELAGFDWKGFYSDTRSCPLDATLGRIPRHLPKARTRSWKAVGRMSRPIAPFATPAGASWSELRIRFTSDFQVQVTVREVSEVRNYVEMGFEDRRAGRGPSKPDSNWVLFRKLADLHGRLQRAEDVGLAWSKVETRVQTIRRRLRAIFRIPQDPIEYEHKTKCYRARLQLEVFDDDRSR